MISVIVPVYNAEKWIHRCVESLLGQTQADQLEIILVDDGSVDQSSEILDGYAEKYSRVHVLHGKNQGVSGARNRGLDLACGEYIAFVDADDYVEPDYFEMLLKEAKPGMDLVCSGFVADYPDLSIRKQTREYKYLNQDQAVYAFLKGEDMDPNITNKLFSRRIIGQNRLDKRFILAEDKYFLFQCLKQVKQAVLLPECKYHYIMNDTSACRTAFSPKKLCSLQVAQLITEETRMCFPAFADMAGSMEIDVCCRIYGDIYASGEKHKYEEVYEKLKTKIHGCNFIRKYKNSSRKHFLAFTAAWIHPGVYNFLKNDMRLQYRK